jgi:hypothetical protein
MPESRDPAPVEANDPGCASRQAARSPVAGAWSSEVPGAAGAVRELQRAIGNAALQRLLRSATGPERLRRAAAPSARVLARRPELSPDEPVQVERHFELDPSTFLRPMNAPAEREKDAPGPATGTPDFSQEAAVNTLTALEAGDHVWYWAGRSSKENVIPRDAWFPGHGTDPLDYLGNGGKIYNFVVYPDHVKCGQPQMTNKSLYPGSFAWLNNNPGNLSGPTADVGQYPGKLNGSPPKTPGFLVFPTPDAGRDALPGWLAANGGRTKYIDMSIADAWQFYDQADAPRYTKLITDALGVPATTILNTLTEAQWTTLKATVRQAEGTLPGWTYSRSDQKLPAAIRGAL